MSDLFKLGLEVGTGQKHPVDPSSIHVAPVPPAPTASTPSSTASDTPRTLRQLTTELLQTERTYIKRLRALKETYADPLRSNALDTTKPVEILTAADTLVLFSNIDEILPLNEEFISQVWRVLNGLSEMDNTIADVVQKHFKNEEFQKEYKSYIEGFGGVLAKYEELVVARTQFAPFLKVADGKIEDLPGVGLKDLLKDPVSRLARYIILFKAMIASLEEAEEPQRAKLEEAAEVIWDIVGGRPETKEPAVEKTET
ncbi:Dbl homology domain-containing protein [Mrakia frigida]|uniref:RhoGEF domain-containing protein n=1 Tax=Mrakia frigida TaxID=29902 RepID=UPI003FCC07F8